VFHPERMLLVLSGAEGCLAPSERWYYYHHVKEMTDIDINTLIKNWWEYFHDKVNIGEEDLQIIALEMIQALIELRDSQ